MDPVDQLQHHLQLVLSREISGESELKRALEDLGGEGPLLLVLEDVERAHGDAITVLARLLDQPVVSVVITGTRGISDLPGRAVLLRPLVLNEVRAMLTGMLRGGAPPVGLAEEIFRLTGGLPAAVAAGVRDLHRRKVLCFDGLDELGELSWRLDGVVDFGSSNLLEGLLGETVESLSKGARGLLEVLAVAGEELPVVIAARVAGLEESGLEPFELVGRKLVDERRDAAADWLCLRRPIIGTLILSGLDDERRREIHASIAAQMEASAEESWRDYRLAYHRAYSGSPEEAPRALVSLGEWLAGKGRFERSLRLLEEIGQDAHLDPLTATHAALARGTALLGMARPKEAADALVAARRLAEEQGRADLMARSLLQLGEARRRYGSSKRAAQAAEEAMSHLSGPLYQELSAQAQLLRGTALTARGEYDSAGACLQGALTLSESQPRVHCNVLGALGRLELEMGRTEGCVGYLQQQIEFLKRQSNPELLVEALYHLSLARLSQGAIGLAWSAAEQAAAVVHKSNLPRLAMAPNVARAAVLLGCSELDDGARRLGQVTELDHAPTRVRLDWWALRARLRVAQSDRPAALAAHHRGMEEAERAGWMVRRAFHEAMEAVLTGRGQALQRALAALRQRGAEHYTARILLMGVEVGGDTDVLSAAVRSARRSGDRLLLLEVLRASGGAASRAEALMLAEEVMAEAPGDFKQMLERSPMVRWARS